MVDVICPCGSGDELAECCGPVLAGERPAATAEQVMRSRFTAFALGDAEYLVHSWVPETRPDRVTIDPDQQWTKLEIIDTVDGRELAATGVVEFRAHYERAGEPGSLHERSNFRRHQGRWVYVDGAVGT